MLFGPNYNNIPRQYKQDSKSFKTLVTAWRVCDLAVVMIKARRKSIYKALRVIPLWLLIGFSSFTYGGPLVFTIFITWGIIRIFRAFNK
tara:strand:- start:43 stop:309 length:267 start_codon:yes stop_codon:yes gene_type:complete